MTFSYINSVKADGGITGGTTSQMDTTGANLLIIAFGGITGALTLSDTGSNTFTGLTSQEQFGGGSKLFYCINPNTSASHDFTASGSVYGGLCVGAYSATGAISFDQQSGSNDNSGIPGSITTPSAALVILGLSNFAGGGSVTSTSVGDIRQNVAGAGGTNYGNCLIDYIQSVAGAVNPTVTVFGSASSTTMATFVEAAGGITGFGPLLAGYRNRLVIA